MEQAYFQIQLNRAVKEAERLVKTLYAVKMDYADKRMEEALTKSVTAARMSESVALKTRALPACTGHPQAEVMIQKAIEEAVPIEMGFTEEGWFCLRMPILLPRKEKSSRSYLRGLLYLALERFTCGKPKIRYQNCVLIFRHVYDRNRPEREYRDHDNIELNTVADTDFEGNYYVACSHVKEILTKINQLRLGVEEVVPYINTGVMVMNLTALRENLTIEQIRETAQKKMHTFLLPDQDLLTVMHGEQIKLVDTMRYNLSDRLLSYHNSNPRNQPLDLQWVRKNVVIIHYYGKNKPWKSGYNGILDVFYYEFQT